MIQIEILWDDLTEKKQNELLAIFGDNNNWDTIPMVIIDIEEDTIND